jgi:hypothetical protein
MKAWKAYQALKAGSYQSAATEANEECISQDLGIDLNMLS